MDLSSAIIGKCALYEEIKFLKAHLSICRFYAMANSILTFRKKTNTSRKQYFRLNHCLKTFTGNTSCQLGPRYECEH